MTDETKKVLLRCPNCGCGLDFTKACKCVGCGRVMCECAQRWNGKPYCKKCRKEKADAASRAGNS